MIVRFAPLLAKCEHEYYESIWTLQRCQTKTIHTTVAISNAHIGSGSGLQIQEISEFDHFAHFVAECERAYQEPIRGCKSAKNQRFM